jgi:hypothetical protein
MSPFRSIGNSVCFPAHEMINFACIFQMEEDVMVRGRNEKTVSIGATPVACLALLFCVFCLVSGVAATAERPAGSDFPTIILYVGSG